jgi:hypothetical protein
MKNLLILTALIEGVAGLVFLVFPSVFAMLLFGSSLDAPAALMIGRLLGSALITLGVACWFTRLDLEGRAAAGLVTGTVLYHIAAGAILAYAGFGLGLLGDLLGIGVVFHSLMAVWCLACLRNRRVKAGNKIK